MHFRQSLRSLALTTVVLGGLSMQFCHDVRQDNSLPRDETYPTDLTSTTTTVSDHISSTSTDLATGDATNFISVSTISCPLLETRVQSFAKPQRWICAFVVAAQRLLDEQVPVFKEIGSELATRTR